jgi:hypothetical protein
MELPEWVKAECSKEINKPTPSMQDRVDRLHAAAYRCGYLRDHVTRTYVWVGEGPEPREDPRRRSGTNAQR